MANENRSPRLQSGEFHYLISIGSMFLGIVYILRWIITGTRSFLAPAVAGLLPLSLVVLKKKLIPKLIKKMVTILIFIYCISFILIQESELAGKIKSVGFEWNKISYAQVRHHQLIDKYVPKDSTLFLLVHSKFMDYTAFGQNYSRVVYQLPNKLNKKKIEDLYSKYPKSYIYLNEERYKYNFDLLKDSKLVTLMEKNKKATLFRFKKL